VRGTARLVNVLNGVTCALRVYGLAASAKTSTNLAELSLVATLLRVALSASSRASCVNEKLTCVDRFSGIDWIIVHRYGQSMTACR
jgi:hypothetical protein